MNEQDAQLLIGKQTIQIYVLQNILGQTRTELATLRKALAEKENPSPAPAGPKEGE